MYRKIIFSIFFLCFSAITCRDKITMDMLVSFATHNDYQTFVLLPYLCWTPYELRTFARKLSDAGVSVSKSLQPGLSEDYLQRILIIADLDCHGVSGFLNKADETGYFKSPYRWLLLGEDVSVLDQLAILPDSDVIVSRREGDSFRLVEVYKVSEGTELIYTTRLSWRPDLNQTEAFDNLVNTTEDRIIIKPATAEKYGVIEDYRKIKELSSRRMNLRRHTLVIANILAESNETQYHLDDRLQLQHDVWTKISYLAARTCFEMLNATEKNIFTNTWGYKDKNGSWQGMVDLLIKKQADVGTLALFTRDRLLVIDYIANVADTSIRFIFREPPLSFVTNIFALPFSGTVWIACFFCVLICSVFLYGTAKWEAYMDKNTNVSGADVFILAIGAVLQQGSTREPRHPAGRAVFFLLYIALTILFSAYSANIVVLLRAPSSSISSLRDLLHSPLTLAANDIYYNHYFFKRLNDSLRKAIYEKKIAPKRNYYNVTEGVERIRKGLFAFHSIVDPIHQRIEETFQEHEKCDLVEIDYLNEIDPWLPAQKRSPYRDLMKISFLKYHESGLRSCNQRRIRAPKPRCSGPISTFSSVGITDLYHVMLASLYGVILAIGILFVELAHKKLVTSRRYW